MEDKPGPRKTTIQDSCEAKPTIINFENKYNISNDVLDGIFSEENKAAWRKEVEKEHKPVQPSNQKVSEIKKICNKRVIGGRSFATLLSAHHQSFSYRGNSRTEILD